MNQQSSDRYLPLNLSFIVGMIREMLLSIEKKEENLTLIADL
jgi:hypothetical protein